MYLYAVNVYLPKDRVTNMHQQYGFVEYRGEEDADYVSCKRCYSLYACCKVHSILCLCTLSACVAYFESTAATALLCGMFAA